MIDIYWDLNSSGFYALEGETQGYIFVGREEHQRLLDATMDGSTIVLNDKKDGLMLQAPKTIQE